MISSTFNECMSQSSKADALSGSFLSHRRTLIMRGLCLMWFETEQAGITQVECADPAELTRYTSLISQSPLETLECCPERNRTSLLVSLSQVKIETEFVGHIFMLQNHWFTSTHCNTVQSNCQSLESKKEKKGGAGGTTGHFGGPLTECVRSSSLLPSANQQCFVFMTHAINF